MECCIYDFVFRFSFRRAWTVNKHGNHIKTEPSPGVRWACFSGVWGWRVNKCLSYILNSRHHRRRYGKEKLGRCYHKMSGRTQQFIAPTITDDGSKYLCPTRQRTQNHDCQNQFLQHYPSGQNQRIHVNHHITHNPKFE